MYTTTLDNLSQELIPRTYSDGMLAQLFFSPIHVLQQRIACALNPLVSTVFALFPFSKEIHGGGLVILILDNLICFGLISHISAPVWVGRELAFKKDLPGILIVEPRHPVTN